MIPFIDGVPLVGIHPTNLGDKPEVVDGSPVRRLRFDIERNEKNREAWSQLLRLETLGFKRPVKVTVGFENGETLDTLVTYPGTEGGKSQAYLRVIPGGRAILGLLLIGGGLVFFLLLAAKTDIVRDTTVRYRPDGRSPFSLGRAQMAFWFFLVVLSYFVLWMVTGDKDTITDSTAVLIGISAATALGAAYADSRKTDKEDKSHSVAAIEDLSKPRRQILALLERNRTSSIEHCRRLRQERDAIAPGETEALAAKNRKIEEADSQLAILEQQIRFFHLPAWRRVFDDLLTENEGISFHKFQIFVWTLILGVIFIYEVLINLAMPEFNTTLLAIMGISGGTYIGFKLPSGAKTDQ